MRRIQRLEAGVSPACRSDCGRGPRSNRRLKSRPACLPIIRLRFGNLRRLPPDYQGERHRVIAERLPDRDGREWVEYEEVPGPPPMLPPQDHHILQINVVFV
jgi:hypothetical protein